MGFYSFFCWNKKFSIAKWKVGLKQNLFLTVLVFLFLFCSLLKRFSLIFHFFSGRVVCAECARAHYQYERGNPRAPRRVAVHNTQHPKAHTTRFLLLQ